MEQPPPTTRRWFRFSLRTMLVLVTLVCVLTGYLGWAMNWKRRREAFLKLPGIQDESEWFMRAGAKRRPAPFPLGIVGEAGVSQLDLNFGVEAGVQGEAERLFPEATISVVKYIDVPALSNIRILINRRFVVTNITPKPTSVHFPASLTNKPGFLGATQE